MRTATMRACLCAALLGTALLGGCGYYIVRPDPIRLVDSPVDVTACRSLGRVGPEIRTEGSGPFLFNSLTMAIRSTGAPAPFLGYGTQQESDNLAVRLQAVRDEALNRGATDLLLARRRLRDWTYIQGYAYLCRR